VAEQNTHYRMFIVGLDIAVEFAALYFIEATLVGIFYSHENQMA
jgi:hypothetical protein